MQCIAKRETRNEKLPYHADAVSSMLNGYASASCMIEMEKRAFFSKGDTSLTPHLSAHPTSIGKHTVFRRGEYPKIAITILPSAGGETNPQWMKKPSGLR